MSRRYRQDLDSSFLRSRETTDDSRLSGFGDACGCSLGDLRLVATCIFLILALSSTVAFACLWQSAANEHHGSSSACTNSPPHTNPQGLEERRALMTFFVDTNLGWPDDANWTRCDQPATPGERWGATTAHSYWKCVQCDQASGSVTSLDLSNAGLAGTIPEGLSRLTRLEKLDLSRNSKLGGSLPNAFKRLPQLKSLSLSDTNTTRFLPLGLASLALLQASGGAAGPKLSGTLPADMNALDYLYLSGNVSRRAAPHAPALRAPRLPRARGGAHPAASAVCTGAVGHAGQRAGALRGQRFQQPAVGHARKLPPADDAHRDVRAGHTDQVAAERHPPEPSGRAERAHHAGDPRH
jgi:hypothetical protein